MSVSLTSPVTGGTQTGFTTPTYTVVADTPPNAHSKQYAVTAVGGAGNTPSLHSASSPFSITFSRPAQLKSAPIPNPVTGIVGNSPRNTYTALVRKGMAPGTNQNDQTAVLRCDLQVVAGADSVDPVEVRAALSLLIGALNQQSAGIGDTLITAIL